jgi:hypothetical protein
MGGVAEEAVNWIEQGPGHLQHPGAARIDAALNLETSP